ncbi:MAG: anti-sigma factor RsbA family regulatory protein [Nocardioidaceae bacterium]
MSLASCTGSQRTDRFLHEAVFYRGLDDLVARLVPFIREGIALDEPVLVALLPERLAALEQALGADATRVDFVDMAELGRNPACIIPEWRRFLEEAGSAGPVRGVGEPVWSGRRAVEVEEAGLHEALLNVAFDGGPAWRLVCPYDVDTLPQEVIAEAARNHPGAVHPGIAAEYGGHSHAIETFSNRLSPPPSDADVMVFEAEDLTGLRSLVGRLAEQAGVPTASADDLVLACHELATNSVLHGGGGGTLRAWRLPDSFVVEVSDTGVIEDPLVGRDLLQDLSENGRGVWMANQLCDLVQVRSSADGTVVRLFSWL